MQEDRLAADRPFATEAPPQTALLLHALSFSWWVKYGARGRNNHIPNPYGHSEKLHLWKEILFAGWGTRLGLLWLK